jgi:catecholate siderophore receptor
MVDTILANYTDVTWEFVTGPLEHDLVTSIEYARETSLNHLRAGPAAPLADLSDPSPDVPYEGRVSRTGARNEAIADTFAVSAFDTIKLTEQWQLTGGLRWDHFEIDYESRDTNGVLTTIGRTDEMLSWRVGAVYKPVSNGTLYAAYGTSFNPSAEGLTLSTGAAAANSVNTDPEESRTYEIGTKWDLFDRRLLVSLALFRTEKTNARTEDPADPTDVVVLEGEQRVDGIEVGIAGSITPDWRVFGGYTFLESEVRKSRNPAELGNELSNTPRHTLSLWTTYELPWNLEIGAGAQFTDSRFSNTANTREAPGYWLFDAMAAYHVNERLSLRLNVYNLADKEYIDRVGGGHFIPGGGRFAMVKAAFKF